MRRSAFAIVFTLVVLAAAVFPWGNTDGEKIRTPTRALTLSGPIHIYGEMDLASEASSHGWPGNGSEVDPYLIEDYDIDGSGESHGLFIGNIESHLRIINCTVHDADTPSSPQYQGNGIYIVSAANITIEDCTIENNRAAGIFTRLSDSIIVRNNTLRNTPQGDGAYFWGCRKLVVGGNQIRNVSRRGMVFNDIRGSLVAENSFMNTGNMGIMISDTTDSVMIHNTVGPETGSSVMLSNDCTDLKFYSNVLVDGRLEANGETLTSPGLDIPANNTVHGSPVYHYSNTNQLDNEVPSDAGQVIAANITHLSIRNLSFTGSGKAIMLFFSEWITIEGCSFTGCDFGTYIASSENITISGSVHKDNGFYGSYLWDSSDTRIINGSSRGGNKFAHLQGGENIMVSGCYIEGGNNAIYIRDLSDSRIIDNVISDTDHGFMEVFFCDGVRISGNQVRNCSDSSTMSSSLRIFESTNLVVVNNYINESHLPVLMEATTPMSTGGTVIGENVLLDNTGNGIELVNCMQSILRDNLIFNSEGFGIELKGSSSVEVINNTLIENNNSTDAYRTTTIQAADDSTDNRWYLNGSGNHWRDWTGPDNDGDGIVDEPYLIFGGSYFDMYPLTRITYEYLSKPLNVTATASRDSVLVSWEPPEKDMDGSLSGYIINRRNVNGSGKTRIEVGSFTGYKDTNVSDGISYSYTVTAVGRIGPGIRSEEVYATPDSSYPEVVIISPSNASVTDIDNVTAKWNVSDNVGIAEVYLSVDGSDWMDAGDNTTFTMAELNEGSHHLSVKAFDHQGNNATETVTFTVDMSPPALDILFPEDGTVTSEDVISIEWNGFDLITSIESYQISVDGADWTPLGNITNTTITLHEQGRTRVRLRCFDEAGNQALSSVNLTLDKTPPDLFFTFPPGDLQTYDTSLTVSWAVYDLHSGVMGSELILDGGDPMDIPVVVTEYLLTNLEPGDHEVTLRAVDLAGNTEQVSTTFEVIEDEEEEETTTIEGKVIDEKGEPIRGAEIRSDTGGSTTTDSMGRFSLEVPVGMRTITIEGKGYEEKELLVDATSNETVLMDDTTLSEEDENGGDGLIGRARKNLACQICCLLMIVIPLILILLGLLRRARSKKKKNGKQPRRKRAQISEE